jgi:hypothetical protein
MGTKAPGGAGGEGESSRGRGVWHDILVSHLVLFQPFSLLSMIHFHWTVLALHSHFVVSSDYG